MPKSVSGQVIKKKKNYVDHESRSEVRLWTKEKSDLATLQTSLL